MSATIRHDPVDFQDRDFALLRGLFESRVMTVAHVATLYFEGRFEAAKKRLQKLKAAGVIGERPRRVYEPSVLFLTRKAFALLSERGFLVAYPRLAWSNLEKRARVSDLTLRHELAVMDVKAAITQAIARTPNFAVVEFSTWPLLYQFQAAPRVGCSDVLVKPDGYIRVQENEPDGGLLEHTFFLEVDRSTEPQETLATRAGCYLDYYRRGGLAARNGRPREEYKHFPFRVLMVFRNAERRNNTAERLLLNRPPILTQVWLTTFAEVIADPLGVVWIRPADYRDATHGTAYDADLRRGRRDYRREPEREKFVEQEVQKHQVLRDVEPTVQNPAPVLT